MLKKILLIILLLFTITLPQFVNAQSAQSACCIFDLPIKQSNIAKQFIFGYEFDNPENIKVNTTLSLDQCNDINEKFETKVKRGIYVENYEKQCKTKNQVDSLLYSNWCCVTRDYYKPECTSIKVKSTCQRGSLYEQTCHSIQECKSSQQLVKYVDQEIQKSQEERLKKLQEELKSKILNQQIKPKLSVGIPGFGSFSDATVTKDTKYIIIPWIAEYIKTFYEFAIGIAGVVATVIMMVGGFMWIMSGGDSGKVNEAKEYIKASVFGLVLILTAYFILNYLNPELINPKPIYLEIPESAINLNDFSKCEIDYATTPAPKSINGGVFCDDFTDTTKYLNLQDKKVELPKIIIPNVRNKAYVTLRMYEKLKKANDDKNILEEGEKLDIGNTSRSLLDQTTFCNCWEMYKASNYKVCPQNCGCNYAPGPSCKGSGGHRFAMAADLRVVGTNKKFGTLNCGSGGMRVNCATHISDPTAIKIRDEAKQCTPEIKNCQDRLKAIMDAIGAKGISNEWWHYEF